MNSGSAIPTGMINESACTCVKIGAKVCGPPCNCCSSSAMSCSSSQCASRAGGTCEPAARKICSTLHEWRHMCVRASSAGASQMCARASGAALTSAGRNRADVNAEKIRRRALREQFAGVPHVLRGPTLREHRWRHFSRRVSCRVWRARRRCGGRTIWPSSMYHMFQTHPPSASTAARASAAMAASAREQYTLAPGSSCSAPVHGRKVPAGHRRQRRRGTTPSTS